jgi:hypothetical protein
MEKEYRLTIINGKTVYLDYPTELKNVPKNFPFSMLNYEGRFVRPFVYDEQAQALEVYNYLWVLNTDTSHLFRMSDIKPCKLLVPDISFEALDKGF